MTPPKEVSAPCAAAKPAPSPRKGGRPVTWVGGGGLDPKEVAEMGVPELRALFLKVFGHPTGSNNSTWLRRKLSDPPDANCGQGRNINIKQKSSAASSRDSHITHSATVVQASLKKAAKPFGKKAKKRPALLTGVSETPWLRSPKRARRLSETGSCCDAMSPSKNQADNGPEGSRVPADVLKHLQHLSKQGLNGSSTIEVFWPEAVGEAGSWWPARVVKVMPRRGRCSIVYDTNEVEELDLVEIIEAGHLRLLNTEDANAEPAEVHALCTLPTIAEHAAVDSDDSILQEAEMLGLSAGQVSEHELAVHPSASSATTPVWTSAQPQALKSLQQLALTQFINYEAGDVPEEEEAHQAILQGMMDPVAAVGEDCTSTLSTLDTQQQEEEAKDTAAWLPGAIGMQTPQAVEADSRGIYEMFSSDTVPNPSALPKHATRLMDHLDASQSYASSYATDWAPGPCETRPEDFDLDNYGNEVLALEPPQPGPDPAAPDSIPCSSSLQLNNTTTVPELLLSQLMQMQQLAAQGAFAYGKGIPSQLELLAYHTQRCLPESSMAPLPATVSNTPVLASGLPQQQPTAQVPPESYATGAVSPGTTPQELSANFHTPMPHEQR